MHVYPKMQTESPRLYTFNKGGNNNIKENNGRSTYNEAQLNGLSILGVCGTVKGNMKTNGLTGSSRDGRIGRSRGHSGSSQIGMEHIHITGLNKLHATAPSDRKESEMVRREEIGYIGVSGCAMLSVL